MNYINISNNKNNGIDVISKLCLGCLNFGTKTSAHESIHLLNHFVEAGGNFLDTANNYAFWNTNAKGGESETLIGDWLQQKKNRHEIFLATKCGAMPLDLNAGFGQIEGLSKKAIENAIDQSLKRLQTDYIDLYYAHITDPSTPLEETLETFNQLIKSGKVRYIGCSNFSIEHLQESLHICETHNWQPFNYIQQRYTYLQPRQDADFGIQKTADQSIVDFCSQNPDLTLLAYSPLLGGYYNTRLNLPAEYQSEHNNRRLDRLSEVATELNATPCQIVLAWMLQHESPVLPLVASSSIAQLDENLGALNISLSPEHLEKLNALI